MIDKHLTVDAIRWRSVLPWLNLLRAAQLALRVRPVLLAMLALFVWRRVSVLFHDLLFDVSNLNPLAIWRWNDPHFTRNWGETQPQVYLISAESLIWEVWPWETVTSPAAKLFEVGNSWPSVASAWTNLLWSLLVWAIFGGAITRIAAVRFARDESVPLFTALKFSSRNWQCYLYGPLLPMLGVGVFAALGSSIGALNNWWNVGTGGVMYYLGFIPVLCGLAMAFLLLLTALSWPLMIAAISTEGSDGFDGLSRAFGYVMNRPWYFAFLLCVSYLVGTATLVGAKLFAAFALTLAEWSTGIPRGSDFEIWRSNANLAVLAVMVCYFWSATTVIYFLLRQSEDGTPLDQVYIPGPPPKPEPLPVVGVAASQQAVIEQPLIDRPQADAGEAVANS